jgi:DNA-binding response OmpR family regulator
MLPGHITIVEDDSDFRHHLGQHLRALGARVAEFADSNELLAADAPYDSDFYLLDLILTGVAGEDLIRVLRRRSQAGIVVVSGKVAPDVFETVLDAGADMYLAKPVSLEQITLAVKAVHRRAAAVSRSAGAERVWLLDPRQRQLTSPEGVTVALGDTDVALLACFPEVGGAAVSHAEINSRLGRPQREAPDNSLHAMIYRLRRRIEKVTGGVLPLQAQSRVGYVFKAPIRIVDGG